MILIADSGSTKTTWCFCDRNTGVSHFTQTAGINPYYQDERGILNMLKTEFTADKAGIESLFFYGAGCTDLSVVYKIATKALSRFFKTEHIEVESDLMAAATIALRK